MTFTFLLCDKNRIGIGTAQIDANIQDIPSIVLWNDRAFGIIRIRDNGVVEYAQKSVIEIPREELKAI